MDLALGLQSFCVAGVGRRCAKGLDEGGHVIEASGHGRNSLYRDYTGSFSKGFWLYTRSFDHGSHVCLLLKCRGFLLSVIKPCSIAAAHFWPVRD